jgi:hypothetical protein
MVSWLFLMLPSDPPAGGVSPLSWVIIGALAATLVAVSLFAKYWTDRLYSDLKECNAKKTASEEDILGVLKVLRLQMEQSRGGKKG